ncbi:SDR family NAD(P)-dependent oxidoreductase [Pedobacter sp. HMF7647]|uniref:SDR family NAD(P)-dependent oxidoreductase n=1 Tax=Hufsiella arboris TaxID=2695275 RepID=A0A7K1YAV5_9SPHI|nr:SDR family NAD(P)-dependent oxidoreductase [Hufsiella arboris]MXV51560.1 SDR family NAD(P)-dependent oxidoreductase [Hufsiella arboris]
MKIDLKGKIALITGGSKGIGKGAAEALSGAGATVVICARDEKELAATAQEISGKTGFPVKFYTNDVTNDEDVKNLVDKIKSEVGSVDILVNNAGGIGENLEFEKLSPKSFLDLYDLNVVSMVRFIQAVLPEMKEKKWGRIINISSENGLQPYPDMISYNLTKAANINLSKGISKLVGHYNILVNTVSPAFIKTPLVENMLQTMAEKDGKTVEEVEHGFLTQKRPGIDVGRAGTIEEVGAAIVFLASEQASFINGTNLRVDGGSVGAI